MHRLLLLLLLIAPGYAASLRCPSVKVGQDKINAIFPETAEMVSLWTDLAEPHPDGSDGPLGCPIAPAEMLITEPSSQFSGLVQHFQRGTLLVGNGNSAGFEVAAVRGLGGWFVWWRLPATVNFPNTYIASETKPGSSGTTAAGDAIWARRGFLRVSPQTGTVALWRCEGYPCTWNQATPILAGFSRPFDAAASLDLDSLALPDPSRFPDRRNAIIPDWLPCYTAPPSLGGTLGEDSVARALIMMHGVAPCPLTRVAPAAVINQWIFTVTFPAGQLPGTTSDSWPCKRDGELEITMLGLLHLYNQYKADFTSGTAAHLGSIMQAFGGAPRSDPYVQPDGTCLGFGVIETENHILMQESARYLINVLRGVSSSANRDWLVRFLQMVVRRDFYEYNALPYTRYHIKALYALHDYAPDPQVATAARGALDWLFAKTALSANFDRDHRSYRRRPEPDRYAKLDWWGPPTTAVLAQAALFAGPLQHAHEDIDLEIDHGRDEAGIKVLDSPALYPLAGAADETFAAEFSDAMDTTYVLPEALKGWLGPRFTDDTVNRLTYVQEIHHSSSIKDDAALFAQPNAGVELVSGNRNWTIIAGGNAVPPGFPPNPPGGGTWIAAAALAGVALGAAIGSAFGPLGTVVGGVIGGLLGLGGGLTVAQQANKKQFETLWNDQPGIMRETTLIPSPVGLNRAQTIRFGQPAITQTNQSARARLCVAEGFLCGFDLVMPVRPFPAPDVAPCPLTVSLPAPMAAFTSQTDASGKTILTELACMIGNPGDLRDWTLWTFEHGSLLQGVGDPPGKERLVALWIEVVGEKRTLRMKWSLPGNFHDWYNVHKYTTAAFTATTDAPSGDSGFFSYGDPDNTDKWDKGEGNFDLAGVTDSTWSLVAEACDPSYGWFGIRTGHKCHADIMPKLTVNVALPPKQSFSCAAHDFRGQGLVLEVGDCLHGPFGLFVYVWMKPCSGRCPDDASNYGFVVVAPSRGWTWLDFGSIVETSMAAYTASAGHDYLPLEIAATVNVPISPPVTSVPQSDGTLKWLSAGPPSLHTVTFRFRGQQLDDPNILADTGAPGFYTTLNGKPETWPGATGHITTPDLAGPARPLVHSSGQGCFTVSGIPRNGDSDPRGLVVDLRNAAALVIDQPASSTLAARCP
jgi:hypothetical protein